MAFQKRKATSVRLSYLLGVNHIGYVGKYRGQLILCSESASLFFSDIGIAAYPKPRKATLSGGYLVEKQMPSVMGREPLGALYLTSLHALGAYVGALNLAVNLNGDLLDVRTEGAVAYAMRVADATTSNRCLTADLAYFGHS